MLLMANDTRLPTAGDAMAYTCFEIELKDKVAHLRLSRPEQLNTMNRAFWRELPAAVRQLDAEGSARVIVISSSAS
jgi:enoyl-CoA hydratase